MLDFYVYIGYYKWAVARERLINKKCRSGGIGRRARFRSVCWWQHAGSSPVSRTIKELKISSFLIMFWRLQKQRPLLFYYFTVSINLSAISQSACLTYTRYSYAEFESINGVPCILPGFVIVLVFTVYSIFFSVKIPSTRFKYSKFLVTQISFRLSVNIVNTPWSLHYIQSTSILK